MEGWYLWHNGHLHLETDLDAVPPFTDKEWHTIRCDLENHMGSMQRLEIRMRSRATASLATRTAIGRLQGQTTNQHLYTHRNTLLPHSQAWDSFKVSEITQFACSSEQKAARVRLHPGNRARCTSAPRATMSFPDAYGPCVLVTF